MVTVAVPSEAAGTELATFCADDPELRINENYCPGAAPVADAPPLGWYVRIAFSELIDPSVEELVTADDGTVSGTLVNTQPVDVTCDGAAVSYDGFYDPSGSHLTFPVGPGLVITQEEFVATGTACQVSLKDTITDKDGEVVPDAFRGPYDLTIAPMAVAGTDPPDASEGIDPTTVVPVFLFNAPVDETTIDGTLTFQDDAMADVAFTASVDPDDPTVVLLTPDAPLAEDTLYTVSVDSGITDIAGGPFTVDAPVSFSFMTGSPMGM